jgi:hypothetical protein
MGQLPTLTASMSAVLAQDVSYLKAYLVGRPFFVEKHFTRDAGRSTEPQSDPSGSLWAS